MIARIGCPRCSTEPKASGRVDTVVYGVSRGFGGIGEPIYVYTDFKVTHAVANLALEYDDIDAAAIYHFGNDLNALEIKITYPATGTGFFIEYTQKDPNAESRLVSQWLAIGENNTGCAC